MEGVRPPSAAEASPVLLTPPHPLFTTPHLLSTPGAGLGCIVLHCPADLSTFNNLSQTLRRVM